MLHAGVMAPLSASGLPSPREPGAPYRVCLVCLGNICRSPMAETVLRAALTEAGLDGTVVVDSAGTGDWHIGQPMNSGARGALATDAVTLAAVRRRAGAAGRDRIRLFGEVGGLSDTESAEIPDPYGGNAA